MTPQYNNWRTFSLPQSFMHLLNMSLVSFGLPLAPSHVTYMSDWPRDRIFAVADIELCTCCLANWLPLLHSILTSTSFLSCSGQPALYWPLLLIKPLKTVIHRAVRFAWDWPKIKKKPKPNKNCWGNSQVNRV